jgi:Asp-tRNA(Asn)/Glu-tRNA(Gln) amidotransferase A subunit family amidase
MLDRRRFLTRFGALALTAAVLPRLARGQSTADIDAAAIAEAEKLTGIPFTEDERALMLESVKEHLESFQELRKLEIRNEVAPALRFSPRSPTLMREDRRPARFPRAAAPSVRGDELAFLSIAELGALLRARKVSSVELTRMYLERLERYDPKLECVITLTPERALKQAEYCDRDLARGIDRGPLHGIPWGAKDLFAAKGYRTTWGAKPFEDQVIDVDATVVESLDLAGAVLVAKLSVGALAWGDVWFGGTTKNPWNLEQGSSGSSAGPAAATAAGLVGFAVGTETLGSIVSPSQRCGVTGFRPSFGSVSRYGCMALSWSMDKVGPICRSVDDAAAVYDAIRGHDPRDDESRESFFPWDPRRGLKGLRIGYDAPAFDPESDDHASDMAVLDALRDLGVDLVPLRIENLPVRELVFILEVEAAAAFDALTRSGEDEDLVRQIEQAWPNVFRAARLVPAVEYVQANRARRILMTLFDQKLGNVDAYVHPTYGGPSLVAANLTGHPSVVVPAGFREDGTKTSITFTGRLGREADLLTVARAYQEHTGWHHRHPPGFGG